MRRSAMPKPPVLLGDFEEVIVLPTDTIAEAEVKIRLRLPELVWKLTNYMFDGSGNLSPDVKLQICEEIGCAQTSETS